MQSIVLHLSIIIVVPLQSFPPQSGAGLLQFLVFTISPPPHRLEQFPTGDQFDQPPSTIHNTKNTYYFSTSHLDDSTYVCTYIITEDYYVK